MEFDIRLGVPEMLNLWNHLNDIFQKNTASKNEVLLLEKLKKCFKLLKSNPKHPSLHSHEISQLSKRYGCKVYESYLENNTPGALRLFWVYGPFKQSITIIGIEPHPNDKANAYAKITLSSVN